ncbi:MAG TPA: two-component system activity regulator YycH [Pseudoneobacillus sp.]|nr:two-component system activity regulator YycH [Pseudoneobacillus sp.]
MTYENIKSLILTILVVSSVFLTWNLWTYQPDYETMKNTNYVQEVSIGEKRDLKTIIKPDKVLFHYKKSHFGTEKPSELDKMIREMSQWNIYDIKSYTSKVEDFKNLVHGDGHVEIIFPEEVPFSIYKNVLNFEGKTVPNFSFDRIVIDMTNLHKDSGTVYFVSYGKRGAYISHVNSSNLTNFNRIFLRAASKYPKYFPYEPKANHVLFLPENETEMMKYKYYPDYLDSEKFKEALFSDPSVVQKSFIPDGEEFTDGTSKMNIYLNGHLLLYVNPNEESDFIGSSDEVLQRGIDFINEHGGWTDPYRFAGIDEWNQKITFRLYNSDGYPVFNEVGMSEIIEIWGRNEMIKYLRPNFSLDLPLRTEMSEVQISSGRQIIHFLEYQKDFRPELLEDLRLGYLMGKDPKTPKLIVLEPAWFYLYNGTWRQVRYSLRGGHDGLE